jgi:isopentenyl-diphosphate delta-isomerase
MIYGAVDDVSGLVENEFDHVLVGLTDSAAVPAPDEVGDVSYVHPSVIRRSVRRHPHRYTPWLSEALSIAADHWQARP